MTAWKKQTLAETLAATAAAHAQEEALVIAGKRLTHAELRDNVREVACGLRALGINHGDHVAVCMGNSLEWVIFFYAAASIGAVTVPVNTRFKAGEMLYCLQQADVKLLFVTDRFLNIDFIGMLRGICPALDRILPDPALPLLATVVVLGQDVPAGAISFAGLLARGAAHEEAYPPEVKPDDVLLMQFTSGTTSHPKGVMLTHDGMLRNAAMVAARCNLKAGDRYYSARPFHHVAGTTLSLLAALGRGACLLSSPSFEPEEALATMWSEECTHTSGNDTLFLMMLNHPNFEKYPLKLRGGWASAGPEISRQAVERMGMKGLCQAYGLSEASPNVVMSDWRDAEALRVQGLATPLPGLQLRTLDGEIQVRGWSVMRGYYNNPEATAQAFTGDGWLRTGDLGELHPGGRLKMVGRLKDVFRVGGENVAPAEVEEVLLGHPAVQTAQVVGVPDARLGEVPCAYVTLKSGQAVTEQALIGWAQERCANFRAPRYLRVVESFESIGITASGKVQKAKLREHALREFGL